jgi:hypothetical protein
MCCTSASTASARSTASHPNARMRASRSATPTASWPPVITWATDNLTGDALADYQHNLAVIVRKGTVKRREVGLAASLVALYKRETEKAERQAREAATGPERVAGHRGRAGSLHTHRALRAGD